MHIIEAAQPAQAVAVVCHGLNNPPHVMEGVSAWFGPATTIVRVGLAGHTPDSWPENQDWLSTWISQVDAATRKAQELAEAAGLPLYFMSFSLGGVVWLNMLAQWQGANPFSKAILLAPPLACKRSLQLIHALSCLGVSHLPSFNRKRLRVQRWLPVTMYRALDKGCKAIAELPSSHWQMPVLVLIDPKDELVSFSSVIAWIKKHHLAWQVMPLKLAIAPWTYGHHLLIDEAVVGAAVWGQMRTLVQTFIQRLP